MDTRTEIKEIITINELKEEIETESLLFSIIKENDVSHLRRLIENVIPKPNVNIKNKEGSPPLSLAEKKGHSACIKLLKAAKKSGWFSQLFKPKKIVYQQFSNREIRYS